MQIKTILISLAGLLFFGGVQAQEENEEKGSLFFGINIGAYKANGKTAVLYNGNTTYGVLFQFNTVANKPVFDQYFKYNYKIEAFPDPNTIAYRTTYNVGGFAGVKIDNSLAIFAEVNAAKLKVQDVFTVAISNPNDPTVFGDTYEQIPIFGEESRTNINLGIQATFYEEDKASAYFSLFGNVNNARLEKNYFVINDIPYTIFHNVTPNGTANGQIIFQQNIPPGGIGFGGGAGLGARYKYGDKITFNAECSASYTQTRMYSDFKPFGLSHSLMIRILWGY